MIIIAHRYEKWQYLLFAVNKQVVAVANSTYNRCSPVTCRLAPVHADRSGSVPLS
jgi:hypothetical protein